MSLELTGEAAGHVAVWYRVHSQDLGWLGWTTSGEPAGTEGLSLRAECVEVQLLPVGFAPVGYDGQPAFVSAA